MGNVTSKAKKREATDDEYEDTSRMFESNDESVSRMTSNIERRTHLDATITLIALVRSHYSGTDTYHDDMVEDALLLLLRDLDRIYESDLLQCFGALAQGGWKLGHGSRVGGLYYLENENDNGQVRTKIGESMNLVERTNDQDHTYRTVVLSQAQITSFNIISEETVDGVLAIGLPRLKGHDVSRLDRTKAKIWRQLAEALFHAIFKVDSQIICEFLLRKPSEAQVDLTCCAQISEQIKQLAVVVWNVAGGCLNVKDMDTWTAPLSVLYQNKEKIGHLLQDNYESVTEYLARQNVDDDCYAGS